MSHARQLRRFTPDEYYLIEAQADSRSEYFNGEIFAMAGAVFATTASARILFAISAISSKARRAFPMDPT